MKRMMIDVDECITNNIDTWRVWYYTKTGIILKLDGSDDFTHLEEDPLNFFKMSDMYKNNILNPGVLDFIHLVKNDYNIIFCSACFDEHITSKKAFLNKYFSFIKYHFVSTLSKYLLDVDVAIDDRSQNLRGFRNNPELYQIKTTVNKSHESEGISYVDWFDLITIFKGKLCLN